MVKFRIGRHIGVGDVIFTTPWAAENIGCNIFQIFLGSAQQVLSKARQYDELVKCGSELDARNMIMVIHGSYTINLCHPTNSKRFKISLTSLIQDLYMY